MATLESFSIKKDFGIYDKSTYIDATINVEIGDIYDLLQVAVEETYKIFNVCVPFGTTEEQAKEYAEQVASEITEDDIKFANDFLADIKKWGCD